MANEEAGSGMATGGDYDVFLSFRGPDTRNGFADYLYEFMSDKGIQVFRDEEELHHGKKILEILRAVQSSQIYIPVLSKDYVSSKWCLRELTCMVKHTRQFPEEKEILPIFYGVDPLDVKLETELYKNPLMKHEEELGCTEVKPWKEALTEVAGIRGWHLKGQREGKVIKDIVQKVLQKIPIRKRYLTPHLIGIDYNVNDVMGILGCGTSDVQVVIIHGMRGIGKTTLATAVFNQLSCQFERRSFLANIRESCSRSGIVKIQRKIVADLLGFSLSKTFDFEEGNNVIRNKLPHKRVLLVFDDICDDDQFIQLAECSYLCGPGSRIIVTCRDRILSSRLMEELGKRKSYNRISLYEMKERSFDEAICIFIKHAFNTYNAPEKFESLSREVAAASGGLPLALKEWGSQLRGQDEAKWISTLKKLTETPPEIRCYASFFVNEKKTNAMNMWEALHDQLRDIGRQIICQENNWKLSYQSRLWFPDMTLDIARAKQVDTCGSSKWNDLKPSLQDREVICGLINEKKALQNNVEGTESQFKVSKKKDRSLRKQLERSKQKNNKIQVKVSQLEAKEKIYLRGIVALIGLVCAMLLLKLDKETPLSLL